MRWLVTAILLLSLPVSVHGQSDAARGSAEREVMMVLDDFMSAFNRNDARAEERTYQFPHYRLAGGRMMMLTEPGAQTQAWMNGAYEALRDAGWAHSAWTRRGIVHLSDSKAHVDTEFTRYRQDGSIIGSYESLYIVTKENGRWGIKLRSSFAQ
ncbi:hypothetical protein BH23GEM3_BH23GEM3_02640 [soil metagenome]